jgi:RNA polymerase sigma-70 factor, ECF subfamily
VGSCAHRAQGDPLNKHGDDLSVVAPVAAADVARLGQSEMGTLVAEARDGDRGAFDALVRRTWADTYSLAFRLTGNAEDARDVCASTQLGRRRRHRHEELDDDLELSDLSPSIDPVGRSESASLRDAVQKALAALPPKLRAVVVLRDIYDLSHEVIAAELGISVSAAKVRLHRARHRLRDDVFLRSEAEGRAHGNVDRPAV